MDISLRVSLWNTKRSSENFEQYTPKQKNCQACKYILLENQFLNFHPVSCTFGESNVNGRLMFSQLVILNVVFEGRNFNLMPLRKLSSETASNCLTKKIVRFTILRHQRHQAIFRIRVQPTQCSLLQRDFSSWQV